jgi:hypothetical protein
MHDGLTTPERLEDERLESAEDISVRLPSGRGVTPAPGRAGFSIGIADVYVGIAILAVLVSRFVPNWLIQGRAPCTFRTLTGVPCPGCGFTRSFLRSAHLDLEGALLVSPLGTALFFSLALFGLLGIARLALRLPWPRFRPSRRTWRMLGLGMGLVFFTNWMYLLYRLFVIGDWA